MDKETQTEDPTVEILQFSDFDDEHVFLTEQDILDNHSYFDHLDDVNQTYFDHFKDALWLSMNSLISSTAFFVHALWPDIFKVYGSSRIDKVQKFIHNKDKKKKINLDD